MDTVDQRLDSHEFREGLHILLYPPEQGRVPESCSRFDRCRSRWAETGDFVNVDGMAGIRHSSSFSSRVLVH
jgi:hypothetical protein